MKKVYTFTTLFLLSLGLLAQCPTVSIDRDSWTVESFDTEETNGEGPNNGHAIHAIDGDDATFWHTQWQDFEAGFPHFIAIDMGAEYPIEGISLTTRFDSPNNKPENFELYLSNDPGDWGEPQAAGDLIYDDPEGSGALAAFNFGAVNARYFKLVFHSATDNSNHSVISEIYATALDGSEGCTATGQSNQILTFDQIPQQYTDSPDMELEASSNSGLPITFTVDEGPATLNDNMLSLTGEAGMVTVTAHQAGNETYYPDSLSRTFEVVDLSIIAPEVSSGLSEANPIKMPQLMAYRLYANARTEEAEALDIADITFEVDGDAIESEGSDGHFMAWWTPQEYGDHEIVITAISSNGMESEIVRNVTVSNSIETTTATTLDGAVIDLGTIGSQWYYGTYELPQSVGAFEQIIADFAVTCPNVPGGCDDWDRLAYVQIKNKKGEWIELFRYITPYGVPCDHSIDVTDYESVLQGTVDFRVYIETWGTGGWKMDLNLTYEAGTPEFAYTTIEEAWQGIYNFGDPDNLQPVPTHEVVPPEYTEEAIFRLVTTGHGWGDNNSGNAAEFYFATHHLQVNGENAFVQDMEVDCNPNPDGCTGQQGTWYYNRAGWCPGTIPAPYVYDLTDYIGAPFDFDYEFETGYQDQCHPNNPYCVDGITCPDCNAGYNPHYRIGGYVIYKSNDPLGIVSVPEIGAEKENKLSLAPNPTTGVFQLTLENEMNDLVVQIFDVRGVSLKTYFFDSKSQLSSYRFELSELPKGVYFVKVYNTKSHYTTRFVIQ